jgi:hypothetical protein
MSKLGRQAIAVVKERDQLRAEVARLREAARMFMREIVYNHPGSLGWTVLMDHEPLYALSLLVDGKCITKNGEERTLAGGEEKHE